jgi:hypothetical protein
VWKSSTIIINRRWHARLPFYNVPEIQRQPLRFKQYGRLYWARFPSTILSFDFLSIIIGRVGKGPRFMIDDLGWGYSDACRANRGPTVR